MWARKLTRETRKDDPGPQPPVLSLNITQPVIYTAGDTHVVSGSVSSDHGIAAVRVNDHDADLIGTSTSATFSFDIDLAGIDETTVNVTATDGNGLSSTGTYQLIHDATAPVIVLSDGSLLPPPQINAVYQTPFQLSGTVTESYLAGLRINGQNVGVMPGAQADQWQFSAQIALSRGRETGLQIEAFDFSGSQSRIERMVRLDTALDIEVLSPVQGAELQADGPRNDLPVTIRVVGIAADDQLRVSVDGQPHQVLPHDNGSASGLVSMDASDGQHSLVATVVNSAGTQLASTTTTFSVVNLADLPLAIVEQEPANNAREVEPNAFVAFYFNKAMDPALLTVEVQETAHGQVYAGSESGADITRQSKVELVEVHRDNEVVPGGLSYFPEDTMAAFYPQRDFAYEGTVHVKVLYDGNELSRSRFHIRPLPTLGGLWGRPTYLPFTK
jgi:hypothetical protein